MSNESSTLKIFTLILIFLSSAHASSKHTKFHDLVSEVVAKEVFNEMRIKFEPKSLKMVKKELIKQKVPQHFLSYFSCQLKTITYNQVKKCLKNVPKKESFKVYTTSLSEAITNLYNQRVVVFLM